MGMYVVLGLTTVFTPLAAAREKPDRWLEVRSPHFQVISNGNEKQARKAAAQFERIRSAFQKALPGMRVDPSAPIIVLAVKDEKTFTALEPSSWKGKGQMKRTGLFLRGPEKNYVLLQMNAEGDNPYHVVYHEYTHLLVNESGQEVPLWLDEGLAEFYGNSEILEKEIQLGEPIRGDIQLLRENKLLPLSTLFTVDHSSPYYHEEFKGSIFYAESWALVHYLILSGKGDGQNHLREYLDFLWHDVKPDDAGQRAFGDLKQLERNLGEYVRQSSFKYYVMKGAAELDEENFKVHELTPADSDARRADFLVYNQSYADARALLQEALREDPNNEQAVESMGFLELQQDHTAESKKWFTRAVQLNSQSYLAQYYFAVMALRESATGPDAAQVETSLRAAIKINPNFAPAYDALGSFYNLRGERLEEARMLGLQAVELEPGNIHYRLNVAGVLMRMERPGDAVRVTQKALSMAKTPEDSARAKAFLESALKYEDYLARMKKSREAMEAAAAEAQRQSDQANANPDALLAKSTGHNHEDPARPILRHRGDVLPGEREVDNSESAPPAENPEPMVHGPRSAVDGKIISVKCSSPALLDLTLETSSHPIKLHSPNYFLVQYSALNFTPADELQPCTQLEGMKAHVSFYQVKDQSYSGEIISIQVRK